MVLQGSTATEVLQKIKTCWNGTIPQRPPPGTMFLVAFKDGEDRSVAGQYDDGFTSEVLRLSAWPSLN